MNLNKGFSLVETMISLGLVLLALLFSTRAVGFSWLQSGAAQQRFQLQQSLEEGKNLLTALSFNAPELEPGSHSGQLGASRAEWQVTEAIAGIKEIRIEISGRNQRRSTNFLKSRLVEEVLRNERHRLD